MTTPAVMARVAQRRGAAPATRPVPGHGPDVESLTDVGPSTRRDRSRGEYRSFFTFAAGSASASTPAVDLILEQTATWLRAKGFDEPLDAAGVHHSAERSLTVVHRESSHCHDVRILLAEPSTSRGRWDTELTMHVPERDSGWLSVHVTNDQGTTAAPPRLVRWLLDVVEGRDGSLALTSAATTVRTPDVEDLLEAVCDPDRHGLLFVAGTTEAVAEAPNTFTKTQSSAATWARDVVGLGQVVVLDPLATAEFNAGMGTTHGVEPWTIRTYAPDPDPAWAADARRHRIFSAARLHATRDREVGRILSLSARAHAADRPLPPSVAAADRDLNRALDRLLLDRIFGEATTSVAATPRGAESGTLGASVKATTTAVAAPIVEPIVTSESDVMDPSTATPDETAVVPATASPAVTEAVTESVSEVDARAAAPAESVELQERVRELELMLGAVGRILGLEHVDEDVVAAVRASIDQQAAAAAVQAAHAAEMAELARERLEQRGKEFEELEDDLRFQNDYADLAEELRDEAELRARRAADEAQYFRRQLADAGQYDTAYGVIPAGAYSTHPDSFADLLTRAAELEPAGVLFTGDRSTASGLDAQDTTGRLVRSTWECLLALVGYVEAKRDGKCATGVYGYLNDAPAGYSVVSKNKFAPKESSSTMNRFGDDRIFAVPAEVAASGSVAMEAHFKLGTLGIVSPRMHFYDDTAPTGTGNVYVGYIGPHLRTEGTN